MLTQERDANEPNEENGLSVWNLLEEGSWITHQQPKAGLIEAKDLV